MASPIRNAIVGRGPGDASTTTGIVATRVGLGLGDGPTGVVMSRTVAVRKGLRGAIAEGAIVWAAIAKPAVGRATIAIVNVATTGATGGG